MAESMERENTVWNPMHGKIVVAAIDFGTTCTGYAYSLTQEYKKDPVNIWTKQTWTGSPEIGLQAPTSILFDGDKKFHSFGFKAETTYKDLAFEKKHSEWYFFKHFKMILHDNKNLTRETNLEAANQKLMKAIVVFTAAIKYVTDHLYQAIANAHGDVKRSNIRWVLTVPAIWEDSAKMFMREAAEVAGIEGDQLVLALEPEAASIYCKEQATRIEKRGGRDFLRHFNPGEKYMVLDLGGGTVDVTVNKVKKDGTLKEIYAASGGPWGGITVNDAFKESVRDTVGTEIFSEFLADDAHGWIDLEKEFEDEKRKFNLDNDVKHKLHLPKYFTQKSSLEIAEKFKAKHGNTLEVKENFLVVHASKMEKYFDTAINKITVHISNLLQRKELDKLSCIMLVGGFAESSVVQKKIKDKFPAMTVFVPDEAGISVLKGAVMFGHNPNIIAERISPWTYGVHTRRAFNKSIHDGKRKQTIGGKDYVNNAFVKYIEIGQSVVVGKSSPGQVFRLINPRDSKIFWNVYKSDRNDPVYCDEHGVDFIGRLVVELPMHVRDKTWRLELKMTCRGTELEANVRNADTKEQLKNRKFDFLRNEYEVGNDFLQE